MTSEEYDRIMKEARRLGKEAGENAASWWEQDAVGGRVATTDQANRIAALVLNGLEDGDPAIYDSLPAVPNLSGEWADDPTPQTLAEDLGLEAFEDDTTEDEYAALLGDACDAWYDAASEAMTDYIEVACRRQLAENG